MTSKRPAKPRAKTGASRRHPKRPGPAGTGSPGLEDVAARAARLGITVERVLQEYAWIAFADLRHIAEWGPEGLKPRENLTEADAAPISEIVTGGAGPMRLKLYDKKAALDAIARYLGMFPPTSYRSDKDKPPETAEDAREVLARRLARLAAGGAAS